MRRRKRAAVSMFPVVSAGWRWREGRHTGTDHDVLGGEEARDGLGTDERDLMSRTGRARVRGSSARPCDGAPVAVHSTASRSLRQGGSAPDTIRHTHQRLPGSNLRHKGIRPQIISKGSEKDHRLASDPFRCGLVPMLRPSRSGADRHMGSIGFTPHRARVKSWMNQRSRTYAVGFSPFWAC